MTDWDRYYLSKPTDLSTLYPMTPEVRDSLEDRELERKVRRVARAMTAVVALTGLALIYATYQEWSWLFTRF